MLDFFEKYIMSPFLDQKTLPGCINTAAMFLFGIYSVAVIIYAASFFIKRKETDKNRQILNYFALQGFCLLTGTIFSIYVTVLIFIVLAIASYIIPPYEEGMYQFAKMHGFEYATRFEFFNEMKKYFPKGYKQKDFEQYIDWCYIAEVRKKIIKSAIYHFVIWIFYMIALYTVNRT